MVYARTSIPDFSLANAYYALATVTAYEADADGEQTTVLAPLYEQPVGTARLTNPQTLDSAGKFVRPVYIDRDVILIVSGRTVGTHGTGVIAVPVFTDGAIDTFTGDGDTTVFTLSRAAFTATFLDVTIDGARQQPDAAYTVDGTTSLTFSEAPPYNAEIFVIHSVTTATALAGPTGPTGPGVPTAGAIGQVVTKTGTANYATGWSTPGELKVWEYGDSVRFAGGQPGVIVPFYKYPNDPYADATVLSLLDTIRRYRRTPCIVIVNPSSGPGAVEDGNYTALIRLLQAAGAKVAGYVSTNYAARAEADVKADVDAWLTLYADAPPDTIFFDEQSYALGTDNANVNLYKRYTDYCHDRDLWPVIANPGVLQQEAYYSTRSADIIVIHEQSSWPSEEDVAGTYIGGNVDYKYSLRAALIYNQVAFDPDALKRTARHCQYVYVTNDGLPNPWDSLSSFFADQMAALHDAVPPGGTSGQALVKSNSLDFYTEWATPTLYGDVTGAYTTTTVVKLRGVTVSATTPTTGQTLTYSGTDWAPATPYAGYDIPVFIPDAPTASMICVRIAAVRGFSLPSGLTGSVANAGTAATASTVFAIHKNTTSVGSVTFAAAATTGTFTFASTTSWASGDVLRIIAPASPDATLANISISFLGSRT